jgi:hypothetical protein
MLGLAVRHAWRGKCELDLTDETSHDTDDWRAYRCIVRRRILLLSEDKQRRYDSIAQSLVDEIVGTSLRRRRSTLPREVL